MTSAHCKDRSVRELLPGPLLDTLCPLTLRAALTSPLPVRRGAKPRAPTRPDTGRARGPYHKTCTTRGRLLPLRLPDAAGPRHKQTTHGGRTMIATNRLKHTSAKSYMYNTNINYNKFCCSSLHFTPFEGKFRIFPYFHENLG